MRARRQFGQGWRWLRQLLRRQQLRRQQLRRQQLRRRRQLWRRRRQLRQRRRWRCGKQHRARDCERWWHRISVKVGFSRFSNLPARPWTGGEAAQNPRPTPFQLYVLVSSTTFRMSLVPSSWKPRSFRTGLFFAPV